MTPDTASSRPRASVIILGWNGRPFLRDCLSSVLDQDFPAGQYEVLYVDNGSKDDSAAFVQENFTRVRVIELEHNHGYAEGNNIGFLQTSGEFVVFLNQDTVVHRSWLRSLIEAMTSSPNVGAAHANVIQPWYPEYAGVAARESLTAAYSSEVNRLGYISYRKLPAVDRVYDTIFLHGVCIVLRRIVGEQLGYIFDSDFFAYAEDLDLGLRVRALGYRSLAVPGAVVYHKHKLETAFSLQTFVKTVRIIRNRYLAFYKVMSVWEFVLMVPIMTFGAPFNSVEFGLSRGRQILYGLALIPATVAALAVTLVQLPKYAPKRREVRGRAARRAPWCFRALWRRGTYSIECGRLQGATCNRPSE